MQGTQARYECLLWGGYGFGNVGDELTLAVALHDQRLLFGESVGILSHRPEVMRRQFPDTDVIPYEPRTVAAPHRFLARLAATWLRHGGPGRFHLPRYRLADQPVPSTAGAGQWRQVIARCRQLYLVGGGYLTDLFSIDYFLLPLEVVRAASVPIRTAPLGLGPFYSRGAGTRVASALAPADLVVRDAASLEFCQRHQLPSRLQRDDGFRVREVLPELSSPVAEDCRARRPRLGICVFRQHGDQAWPETRRWWLRLLTALQASREVLDVEGFCFYREPGVDHRTLSSLFADVGGGQENVRPPQQDFRDAVRELRRYDFIVSARFHSIVVANELGIPHVAVGLGESYAVKMAAAVRADDARCRLVRSCALPPESIADHVRSVCRAIADARHLPPAGRGV